MCIRDRHKVVATSIEWQRAIRHWQSSPVTQVTHLLRQSVSVLSIFSERMQNIQSDFPIVCFTRGLSRFPVRNCSRNKYYQFILLF